MEAEERKREINWHLRRGKMEAEERQGERRGLRKRGSRKQEAG